VQQQVAGGVEVEAVGALEGEVDRPGVGARPHHGRTVEPLTVYHGRMPVLGFRFGTFAYVTDCNYIPPESLGRLRHLEMLVLDALRHREHPTHFTVDQALAIIAQVQPQRAFLTHIAHDLDHSATNAALPPGVELGYDGLVLEFA